MRILTSTEMINLISMIIIKIHRELILPMPAGWLRAYYHRIISYWHHAV